MLPNLGLQLPGLHPHHNPRLPRGIRTFDKSHPNNLQYPVSTVLSVTLGPLIGAGCANVFWFFVYKFSVLPLAVLLPVFILLGLAIPLVTYRGTARQSIVERLRTDE